MNKREFFKWLDSQNCTVRPKESINNTSPPIEVENKKTGAYCYIFLSPHSENVASVTIERCITQLGIAPPKGF